MQLVRFEAEDGFPIFGALANAANDVPIIVHVPGKCGNFYHNEFVRRQLELADNGASQFGMLSINHRGHDCLAETYWNGSVLYVGASVEKIGDSHLDLSAAVRFARQHADLVILQGHSLGCEKVLDFCLDHPEEVEGCILLSPSDSKSMQERFAAQRLDEQVRSLRRREPSLDDQMVIRGVYGIRGDGLDYDIPISVDSLLEHLANPALALFDVRTHADARRTLMPVLACVGTPDPYAFATPEALLRKLRFLAPNCTLTTFEESDHHFTGHVPALMRAIGEWILNLSVEGGRP